MKNQNETEKQAKILSEKLSDLTNKINEFKELANQLTVPPHLFKYIPHANIKKISIDLIKLLPQLENLYIDLLEVIDERSKLLGAINDSAPKKFFSKESDLQKKINNLVPVDKIKDNIGVLAKCFEEFSSEGYEFHPIILCRNEEKIHGENYYHDNEQAAQDYFRSIQHFVISCNNKSVLDKDSISDKSLFSSLTKLQESRDEAEKYLLNQVNKVDSFSPDFYKLYVDLYNKLFKDYVFNIEDQARLIEKKP